MLAALREEDKFQSTLPVKGATRPCETLGMERGVSIHAPSEGSDPPHFYFVFLKHGFNPRSQ